MRRLGRLIIRVANPSRVSLPFAVSDAFECGVCTALVVGIQWAVDDEKTMNQIEDYALSVCNSLALADSTGEAMVDCDDKVNMKDVTLEINGVEYTLTPEDYILDINVSCRGLGCRG